MSFTARTARILVALLAMVGACGEPLIPGLGVSLDTGRPLPVATLETFAMLEADESLVCALTAAGEAYCWGEHQSAYPAVGDGQPFIFAPARAATGVSLRWIGAMSTHACGLAADSTAFCWGYKHWLGVGPTDSHAFEIVTAPTAVLGGIRFARLDVGPYGGCGIAADSTAWCWGSNAEGWVGDGTTVNRFQPTRVVGERKFVKVSMGYFTCALTPAGAPYCWGSPYGNAPAPIAGAPPLIELDVGSGFDGDQACGITTAGATWCWGVMATSPGATGSPPRQIAGAPAFVAITVGDTHRCGLTATGDAFCWGTNEAGQLGDGTHRARNQPVRVDFAGRFAHISAGQWFTCALDVAGRAYCWGEYSSGALGIGTPGVSE